MKKIIFTTIIACAALIVLASCGTKTFKCGMCGKEVTGTAHSYSVAGVDTEICDDCYDSVSELKDALS